MVLKASYAVEDRSHCVLISSSSLTAHFNLLFKWKTVFFFSWACTGGMLKSSRNKNPSFGQSLTVSMLLKQSVKLVNAHACLESKKKKIKKTPPVLRTLCVQDRTGQELIVALTATLCLFEMGSTEGGLFNGICLRISSDLYDSQVAGFFPVRFDGFTCILC